MTTRKKSLSPKARPGNRNAAKPAGSNRVWLVAQRIDPLAMAVLTPERIKAYGGIGRVLDTALLALPSVERSMGGRGLTPASAPLPSSLPPSR